MARRAFAACFLPAFLIISSPAAAALVPSSFTGTPDGSWRYFELQNAGHGESTSYFPTTLAEFQAAIFQGYVTYNAGPPPAYWFGQGFDSFQIFSTYVQADFDMSIPALLGGDDGHSLLSTVFLWVGAAMGTTEFLTHSTFKRACRC